MTMTARSVEPVSLTVPVGQLAAVDERCQWREKCV